MNIPHRLYNADMAPLRTISILSFVCLFFLACGSSQDAQPTSHAAPDTLIVGVQEGAAASLDPHAVNDAGAFRMLENMYSTLLRQSPQYGEFEPDLAGSIEMSDDGLTWTIHLVEDAVFHSGTPVTAADVRYSLERIRDSGIRSAHFADVESIETTGEHTLVLHMRQPNAAMRSYLAHPMNAIVDRTVIEATGGDLSATDAGSGPYRLDEWTPGTRMLLVRHDAYHVPDLPRMPRVEYRPISNPTARQGAIAGGDVHLLPEVSLAELDTFAQMPGVEVAEVPGAFWEYVGINTRRPPLDDPRVRRAIAHAIDRDFINQSVKYGQATTLTGGNLPPHHWAYPSLNSYEKRDLTEARRLLAEAGHADGFTTTIRATSAFPDQIAAARLVSRQLKEIGIDAEVETLEGTTFYGGLGRGDFDLAVVGWTGQVDPDDFMYDLFHSDGKSNQQGYSNPSLDEMLESGRTTFDRDARRGIYAQAQRIVAEDAPMVFLYINPQAAAMSEKLEGYQVRGTGSTLGVREARLK